MFKIAHNHCLNEVRKGEYKVFLEPVDLPANKEGHERERNLPTPEADGAEDLLAAKEAADKIQRILYRIPDNQRTAILLSRLEGMSYQEIADVIGCTEKAVKSLVFRATQNLKDGLRDMADDHEK